MRENQNTDNTMIIKDDMNIRDKAIFEHEPLDVAKNINKLLRAALLNSYLKEQSHLITANNNTILTAISFMSISALCNDFSLITGKEGFYF